MRQRDIGCWLILVLGLVLSANAQTTRPSVTVSKSDDGWVIEGKTRTIRLKTADLAIQVQAGPSQWRMMPSAGDDLTVECDGQRFPLKFLDARKIEITPYHNGYQDGVKILLSDFPHAGQTLDLALRLLIGLDAFSQELIFEVIPTEGQARIKECLWPKGFDSAGVDQTVVPYMQGMLLPRNWPKKVYLYDNISYGRGLYMPWWGQIQRDSAALVILETPADGGCRFEHPAGGPTTIQVRWLHSLGKLYYARRVRVCFLEKSGYVELAKRYRRYVIEAGQFVSLKEKIARSPLVGRMIGSPVIHTSILSHIQPDSNYYDKNNPAKNHQVTPFDQRASELKNLAQMGVSRAYVHLDGWGVRGYDNLHPDLLPPCPDAGGWGGLRRLADTADQLGYLFAVHDNYRDYYHDAGSYDPNLTILDENGNRPFGHEWFGGKQSILCSQFAPGHVAKNHRALLASGIKLRGAYLDVFAVVPGDECYNPEHPVTRAQCLKYRGQCLDLIRALEGVVSSEEPADWAVAHIDLVHHAPFALDPNPGGGPAMGIPLPLYSLVYHDALLVPWSLAKGGWGIPTHDSAYLHGLANGGLPYLSTHPAQEELDKVRTMAALHRRVAQAEMLKHEFLDVSHRRQRTTFADGTQVTIDLDKDLFEITPALTAAELAGALSR
ncbi:MAG TPA: DUF5696 domain-containing protein [Tepidisphaeraceae bacterium]|nr:DUF5696 domain-containing protein [Tepidisphaeraceae bacterium]